MALKLGRNAKLYRLTTGTRATWGATDADGFHAGAAPGSLDEVPGCKDITIPMDKSKQQVTTRRQAVTGFHGNVPGLADPDIEVAFNWDPADTDMIAFQKAYMNDTVIACAILDGDKATAGTIGIWGDFFVVAAEKTEEMETAQMMTYTLAIAISDVAPEWVKVS